MISERQRIDTIYHNFQIFLENVCEIKLKEKLLIQENRRGEWPRNFHDILSSFGGQKETTILGLPIFQAFHGTYQPWIRVITT